MDRPVNTPAWTDADSLQAMLEGWDIFAVGHNYYELQQDDERDLFGSDAAAWKYVCEQAAAGGDLHQRALEFLKENSPHEYDAIQRYMRLLKEANDDCR